MQKLPYTQAPYQELNTRNRRAYIRTPIQVEPISKKKVCVRGKQISNALVKFIVFFINSSLVLALFYWIFSFLQK